MEDFESNPVETQAEVELKYFILLSSRLDFHKNQDRWFNVISKDKESGLYDNVVEINIKESNAVIENINEWLLDNGGNWGCGFNFSNFTISFNFEYNNTAIHFKLNWGDYGN